MAQNRDSVSVANDPGKGTLTARLLAEIERREGMHKATLPMRDIVDRHQDSESLAYLAALRGVVELAYVGCPACITSGAWCTCGDIMRVVAVRLDVTP